MPIFITQGRFTGQAMKGMVAKPEDREQQVAGLMSRAGGRLISYYVTMGEYDWICIAEGNDPVSVLSALAVAAAGGGVSDMKTVLAFSSADAMEAFSRANKTAAAFRSAGQA